MRSAALRFQASSAGSRGASFTAAVPRATEAAGASATAVAGTAEAGGAAFATSRPGAGAGAPQAVRIAVPHGSNHLSTRQVKLGFIVSLSSHDKHRHGTVGENPL